MISDETIVEHHPWVEDSSKEMERLKKQEEENQKKMDPYQESFQREYPKGGNQSGNKGKISD